MRGNMVGTPVVKQLLKCAAVVALWIALCTSAGAATVTIGGSADSNIATDVKDATIFDNDPNNSNGAGPGMFAGTDGSSLPLRGLIKFDIAGNIPAGAAITDVQLELFLGLVASSGGGGDMGPPVVSIELHKLSANWGEGTTGSGSSGIGGTGQGFPANPGDATWNAAMYPNTLWNAPGGDFATSASATTSVGTALNVASNWSTPAMVADVQGWLNSPAADFGWGLVNTDETDSRTYRAFWTKEASDPTLRPELLVTYSAVPGDVNFDGVVNGLDISLVSSHWLQTGLGTAGDANGDGVVNGLDIALIASHWLQAGSGAITDAAVPEPNGCALMTIGLAAIVSYLWRRRKD